MIQNPICPGCDKMTQLQMRLGIQPTPEGWRVTENKELFTQAVRAHLAGHVARGIR